MADELHSIVAQLSPSPEQALPIQVRDSDLAVTAGAGTGKTRTLVARYLSLLVDGLPLRTVVAITFTKKAAREMRNRVRAEVRRYLERDDLSDAERIRWRDTYAQLDAARIGTIHSLCAEILRHHPAEAGIDPRFEMLDEGQLALLRAQAVDAALGWAADDEKVVRLFTDFGERDLRQAVSRLLEKRLDVEDARTQHGDDLWAVWRSHLVAPIQAFVDDPAVQAGFANLTVLRDDGTLARAASVGDRLAPDLLAALDHWKAIKAARQDDDWAAVSRHLAPLRDVLKQKGRKSNWAPAQPKDIIAELQVHYDARIAPLVKSGIDLALDHCLAQEIVPALLRLYDRALAHYERAKRTQQVLDFDDLEAQALRLLQTDTDVRDYWQAQIKALLVDEFQDTNGRQRDLLDALNGDGGQLFIVGDAKQSIYRFRGADVTVFREVQQAIDTEGQGYELATSYRAHRTLIQGLNALLRPVLGQEDSERPYIAPFAPLRHHRESPAAGLTPPYVELHLAEGTKSDGALERAAQVLAARLKGLVEDGDVTLERADPETGEPHARPLDYGDVAILCRASTSFAAYENALEAAGIPFLTVAGRGFYDRPEVRDVLNALQTLADPTDDLALAGLLRCFVMGLSDMALYRLREAQRDENYPSLWAMLTEGDLSSLEDEAERASKARDLVQRLHRMVGRTPVAELLKAFLDATAYRAALLRAGETRAARNVDKLLADAHASEIVGVGAFVEYVGELRDVATREGEARAIALGAVQVMTVHQAKGLEFPVVVIGDVARRRPRGGGVLIDQELGVVPPLTEERLVTSADGAREVEKAKSAAYRLAKERDKEQEEAESARLLYVAATRGQELLILSGTVKAYKSGSIGTYGWLKELDEALRLNEHAPSCDDNGEAVHEFAFDVGGQPITCALYEPEADLPSSVAAVESQTVVTPPDDLGMVERVGVAGRRVDEAVSKAERDPPRRVWRVVPEAERAWAPSWVVGELVHLALAHWLFPDDGAVDFDVWAGAEARSYGVTDQEEARNAVHRAARMMRRFRRSELYAAMADAERRLHEVPYSVSECNGDVESGVIDALFRASGQWTLVEFKTDRVKGRADLEALLAEEDYVLQVARYLDASEQLLGERPRPVLCFLNVEGRIHRVADRW